MFCVRQTALLCWVSARQHPPEHRDITDFSYRQKPGTQQEQQKRRESPGSPQLPVGGTWTLQGLGNPKVTTQQRRVCCFFVVVVTCWRFMGKDLGMDVYFFSFKCLSNDMAVCTQDASEWNSLISLDIKQMKEVSVLQCQHTHGAISATSRTAALEVASIKIFPEKRCWRSG